MQLFEYDAEAEAEAIDQVIEAGRDAARRGWVPATAGNFSVRTGDRIAITRSGCDKGALTRDNVAIIALDEALPAGLSAEAPLHVARYRADPEIGAILHVHSPNATFVSRLHAPHGEILLQGWELQKAFTGVRSHEETLRVPIFANDQDVPALARRVEIELNRPGPGRLAPGYLIAGHGIYAWGGDVGDAGRHLEAFDCLLHLQLEWMRMKP